MDKLSDETCIEVFKWILHPAQLALSCKYWARIAGDPHTKATWLIFQYGKVHALFHAVRLGPSFIDLNIISSLLSQKVILSRYFIQRLLMHFGKYDEQLIMLKIEHSVGHADEDRIKEIQEKLRCPWASDLPLNVFNQLLEEGSKRFGGNLPTKGNDMELFHFLSAGPYVINHAPAKLKENLKKIEELIKEHQFFPFPPRPISRDDANSHLNSAVNEEYPPKDAYENVRQLNVIARAILIHPDLVKLWKDQGYQEICEDVNELVMQGALLILFPPKPLPNWTKPDVNVVQKRLELLESLGFKLTEAVIGDALFLFEDRLEDIGEIFIKSFQAVRGESMKDITKICLSEIMKPKRDLKNNNLNLEKDLDLHDPIRMKEDSIPNLNPIESLWETFKREVEKRMPQNMDDLELIEEICIEIFKWVPHPAQLALSCKYLARIAGDPHTKATWLIIQYGKVYALFQAPRCPWASALPLNVFNQLLKEASGNLRRCQRISHARGIVNFRLELLESLGFKLTEAVIGDALFLFEDRLEDIGEIFIKSFQAVRLYEKYSKNVPFNETHLPLLAAAKQEDLLDPFFEKYLPTIFPQQTEENIVQKHQKKRRNFSKTGRKEDEDQKVKWKNTLLKFRDNDSIKDEDGNIYSFGKPTHLFLAKLETFLNGLSGLH
ncbi:hypothetical protein G9A89_016281 [Geosiphon pyriformis]|nr:hypothetical protein G9A89_016281 [Geosiphon pyriformis]